MTTPDDLDPTGMRALLRGLPDPGPMPEDLVHRIQSALAELPALEHDAATGDDGDEDGDVSRGTPAAVRSWWGRHAGQAAVAAVVLLGGGAVASGSLGILGGGDDSMTASSGADAAAPQDLASREADSAQKGSTGPVVVRHSGRDYTAAGLSTQLADVGKGSVTAPLTAESPGIGPIGTELGVRSCLTALGLPRDTAAEVDLASLDGSPAAVIVVTLGGERTAYAVGRDCTTDHPSLLAGPVTLP